MSEVERLIRTTRNLSKLVLVFILILICSVIFHLGMSEEWFNASLMKVGQARLGQGTTTWQPPGMSAVPDGKEGDLIRYGRELIEHTARYLGPKGKVRQISNGMNCQNCHLQGGTKPFGANYWAVATTYPKFRERSGRIEDFERRINDCLERSLNGKALDADSPEMTAMVAYLKWLGKDATPGTMPQGLGLITLPLLDRPADPEKGRKLYAQFCSRCHGEKGEGMMTEDTVEWKYPPLWGAASYNTGAGLFRISKFAGFIKANMPYGITYTDPLLSDEAAWDIAAFVNTMPRPHQIFPHDWPELRDKPMDYPFGPYVDTFSEKDHKYGPYTAIVRQDKQ